MPRKQNIYLIIVVLFAIIFLFVPIELPLSVSSKGKLIPYQTWTLAKGTDGRLITSLNDNSTGINNEFSVTQFERGDAVQFKLNMDIIENGKVSKGDTIGYVISNEIEKDIQKLMSELETARASLTVQESSEKESVIEAEKSKLVFAEKELEEQTKVYDRKKQLFERDLISRQEFEADEARYELAKINISIAQGRLKTVQSGAKEEEINFANSQISAVENEIRILQKRFEGNNIVSPIDGEIIRTFSSDTLLTINDLNQNIVLVPVKWKELKKIQIDQEVSISSDGVDEIITGKILNIDNTVKSAGAIQYVLVTVLSEAKLEELKPGLLVDCNISCGKDTPLNMLLEFIKPLYR